MASFRSQVSKRVRSTLPASITWLYMLLIIERSRQDETWDAFRDRNADLFDDCPRQQAA